jgi:ABC-type transport system involved in cytochrome c biogenesis permease subunit
MASGSLMVMVAGGCFLLAALAYLRGWKVGAWLAAAGLMILVGALAARGLRAGHWPLTSEYEFALAFALTTALATLVPVARLRGRAPIVPAVMMFVAVLLVVYARFLLPSTKQAIHPLLPVLDSVWHPLHVGTASLAYGALALAGAAGLAWLLGERISSGGEGCDGWETARLLDRAIAVGFPLLTLSMIFGMIWARAAWGRTWGWDVKEVWTLITWLVYVLYWHVRRRPRWQGRRLAWLALVGLASVLFTFLGVGWLARTVGVENLQLF